jgi:hypothetical protein
MFDAPAPTRKRLMKLTTLLKGLSPLFLLVAGLHLVLGLQADVLLGARLPEALIADPSLSSQNRFYGVAFGLYGAVFYLAATDLARYAPVLRCTLWALFAAGAARGAAIVAHGWPTLPVLVLMGTELGVPPLLHLWLARSEGRPLPPVI